VPLLIRTATRTAAPTISTPPTTHGHTGMLPGFPS
jgi:hypothetical protein